MPIRRAEVIDTGKLTVKIRSDRPSPNCERTIECQFSFDQFWCVSFH